jgi:hypothetical protein
VSTITDPISLARAVDDRVCALPPGGDPARLFAVRLRTDGDFVLVPFWSGVAREVPGWVCPPRGAAAIVLETGGWAAPLAEDADEQVRPSRHPERRRIHHTVMIHGDGVDVSVLRDDDAPEPVVMEGAVGLVLDLLLECWQRRPAA